MQQCLECPRGPGNLAPSRSRDLEAQGALRTKSGPLDPRRHQLHFGCLRPCSHGVSDPLDAISRYILELTSDPLPRKNGSLRRRNDLVGSGNLSLIPKIRKEEELLGSCTAANGFTSEVVGQSGQS